MQHHVRAHAGLARHVEVDPELPQAGETESLLDELVGSAVGLTPVAD